jgi:ectoine hydroxylase
MHLSAEQVEQYEDLGYLLLPEVFSADEVQAARDESARLLEQDRAEILREERSGAPRHLLGLHIYSDFFRLLSRDRRLIEPAMQLVGESVYVHQFKVNPKTAFTGEAFLWHQDFPVWRRDDGMPEPRAINLAVFLDEATAINGPLLIVPGSHRRELPLADEQNAYILDVDVVEPVLRTRGIVSAEGPPGSVLVFHGNLVHGSGANISPYPRRVVYVSYCAVSNHIRNPGRPEWIAHRDFEAIEPASEEFLRQLSRPR